MAILLSASALGAPDLFKLRNQTAAYWAVLEKACAQRGTLLFLGGDGDCVI